MRGTNLLRQQTCTPPAHSLTQNRKPPIPAGATVRPFEPQQEADGVKRSRGFVTVSIAGTLLLAACNDGGETDPSNPPVPTNTPATASASTPPSATTPPVTTIAPTTPAPTTAATTTPTPTTAEPTDPPTTDPPVETLIPTVPGTLDPDDPNNNRPKPTPEEQEVIDAYLAATQAVNWLASHRPFDRESAMFIRAPLTASALARIGRNLQTYADIGQVLNVDQGLTPRPRVALLQGRRATITDCQLDGTYLVDGATGEVIPPSATYPGRPGQIVEYGGSSQLLKRQGRWLLDSSANLPEACE